MKYNVLGVGNALLDYQVSVSYQFLEKNGFKKGSMQLVDAETQGKLLREIRKEFKSNEIKQSSGGCVANSLAGLCNFGGKAFYIGKIAADDHGEIYRNDLRAAKIDTELHPGATEQTGTCLALITPDAERTMLTHLGIATHLGPKDIDSTKIDESEIVYIEGYLWDSPSGRAASQEAIKIAKAKGKKVAFTYSDSFCVDRHFDDFVNLAKSSVDILFCNETEAVRATNTPQVDEAFKIIKNWAPVVCITTGPRGALLSDSKKSETVQIPTWDVKLVDKLGAGDLFAAGFLFGYTHGRNLKEAGYLGCYSATKIIQQVSARLTEDLSKQIDTAVRGPSKEATASLNKMSA